MRTPQRLTVDAPGPGWKEIATYAAEGYATLVSWLGFVMWRRLDGKASRAELAALMLDMKERDDDAKESRRILHEKLDGAISDMNKTAVAVGKIEGRLNGR